jgi:hypothetical protein
VTVTEAMAINGVPGPVPSGLTLRLAPLLLRRLWAGPVSAMATPRAIWVDPATMARIEAGEARHLLRHELAHVDQWRRYGTSRFVIRYVGDYLLARASGFSHETAYRAIRFERAAEAEARRVT